MVYPDLTRHSKNFRSVFSVVIHVIWSCSVCQVQLRAITSGKNELFNGQDNIIDNGCDGHETTWRLLGSMPQMQHPMEDVPKSTSAESVLTASNQTHTGTSPNLTDPLWCNQCVLLVLLPCFRRVRQVNVDLVRRVQNQLLMRFRPVPSHISLRLYELCILRCLWKSEGCMLGHERKNPFVWHLFI